MLDNFFSDIFERVIKKINPNFDWDNVNPFVSFLLIILYILVVGFFLVFVASLLSFFIGLFVKFVFGSQSEGYSSIAVDGFFVILIFLFFRNRLFLSFFSFFVSWKIFQFLIPFIESYQYVPWYKLTNVKNLFLTYYEKIFQTNQQLITNDLLLFFLYLVFLLFGIWILISNSLRSE
tara:strand:+ start:54 stop:584 length:531 start_codon:yes stop_codon:yes gene_type:complete